MLRGMILFAVVSVVLIWLGGIGAYAGKEALGKFAPLVMIPVMVVPLIMAYVAHRFTGAVGNPFRGLVWGNTSWYFAAWLLGLLCGGVVVVIALGLKFAGWDMTMRDYIAFVVAQSEQSGGSIPESARGALSIGGWVTAFGAPTFGAWLGGAVGCLSTFPWFGWFYRRLLVYGRGVALWVLLILTALAGASAGLIENPQFGNTSIALRVAVMAFGSLAAVPAVLWIFLRTRSAVVPALAQASYSAALAASMPFLSDSNPVLAPPAGAVVGIGVLLVGMALWLWKDPGGKELAVAAVAYDGTPLTPEDVAGLKKSEGSSATPTAAQSTEAPPPSTP
jgi:hypothetical protein